METCECAVQPVSTLGNSKGRTIKTMIAAATALFVLTGTAYANDCPNLIKKDEEMAKAMPGDAATMTQINDSHDWERREKRGTSRHSDRL